LGVEIDSAPRSERGPPVRSSSVSVATNPRSPSAPLKILPALYIVGATSSRGQEATDAESRVNTLWTPPLTQKQQDWRQTVAEALRRLEERVGLEPGYLAENDEFLEIVVKATTIAVKNTAEVKLKALRAAIENAPRDDSPDAVIQQSYLKLVDTLSEWHLRILGLFQDPPAWFQQAGQQMRNRVTMSSLEGVLTEAFPELRGRRVFYQQVWRDLHAQGLVARESLQGTMSAAGASARQTTEMGDDFLEFITMRRS